MSSPEEIYRTYELSNALCVRSFLEAHDIPAFLPNEHHIGVMHWHAVALGGYRLIVFSEDVDEARPLLT